MARTARSADLTDTILAALHQTPGLHSQVLAIALGVDIEAIRAVLLRLEREGQARREGATRGTRWFAAAPALPVGAKAKQQAEHPAAAAGPIAAKPTAQPTAPARAGRASPKTAVLDTFRAEIGTVPDSVVAKRAGVSTELVRQFRKKHGIAGMQERGLPRPPRTSKPPRPTVREAPPPERLVALPSTALPAAMPPSAPARSSVWTVRLGDGELKYVTGATLAEAASSAVMRAGTAEITRIEWFADLW